MRQQAVVTHANAPAARRPPQQQGDQKRSPAKKEQRRDGANMKERHHRSGHPINGLVSGHSSLQSIEFHGHNDPFFYFGIRTSEAERQRKKRIMRGLFAGYLNHPADARQ
jgi:hypothetical protein